MHTDMPTDLLGEATVERARRCWWTAYLLDRELTSLGGMPVSIHDEDLCFSLLPRGSGRDSLRMHIELARVLAYITKTVYGADGRLDRRFLASTKRALEKLAGLADALHEEFPLPLDPASTCGVDRIAACLNLRYNQVRDP